MIAKDEQSIFHVVLMHASDIVNTLAARLILGASPAEKTNFGACRNVVHLLEEHEPCGLWQLGHTFGQIRPSSRLTLKSERHAGGAVELIVYIQRKAHSRIQSSAAQRRNL